MKFFLMSVLVLGSTLAFAAESNLTTGVVFDSSEIQATECPVGYEAQPSYVWSKELHKFVFVGYVCHKVNGHDHIL